MDRRHCLATLAGALCAAAQAGPPPSDARADAQAALACAAIEARTGGRLGLQVTDATGRVLLQHRAGERVPLCSTFKLLAVAVVLRAVEAGQASLEAPVAIARGDVQAGSPVTAAQVGRTLTTAQLCEAALGWSDNTAANLLLARFGGPAAVTAFARSIGDPVTRLDRREPALNEAAPGDERDTTTAAAMAADLRALVLGEALGPDGRARLTGWMRACRTGEARLRAGLPAHTPVAERTGSGEHGTSNDVGVAWLGGRTPRVIAVFLTGARVGPDARDAAIADVARLVARAG